MYARLESYVVLGAQAVPVTVEVHASRGIPGITIVGLAERAVRESRERLRSALATTGVDLPPLRVTVNLAPADLVKEGSQLDLPIALGLLAAIRHLPAQRLQGAIIAGELALDGSVRGVPGILPAALLAQRRGQILILPQTNRFEASLVAGLPFEPIAHLSEAVGFIARGEPPVHVGSEATLASEHFAGSNPLAHIRGQMMAKRALTLAAAGGHNLLLSGPPGTGKTLLARALIDLLPQLSGEPLIESLAIRSAAGIALDPATATHPPFRAPHHTASDIALVGGGNPPQPGEVSLSHRGVLFLDELPEFRRTTLEALRQPLEDGEVTISRSAQRVTFPSRFQLVAAMNPCPCGHLGDEQIACRCAPFEVDRYAQRLSGPFLDRIDLFCTVSRIPPEELLASAPVALDQDNPLPLITQARARQQARWGAGISNATVPIDALLPQAMHPEAKAMLTQAAQRFHLSGRVLHRLIRVAWTLADLAGEEQIVTPHIAEALQFRPKASLAALDQP